MPARKMIETEGYQGARLPLTLWEHAGKTSRLAVIFPGVGYHADLPVLYYPAMQLFAAGMDVLRLEFRYSDIPGFFQLPDDEIYARLNADGRAAIKTGLSGKQYERLILAGKSLGTMTAAALLEQEPVLPVSLCLWLTPILGDRRIRRQLETNPLPGLVAIGTADHYYDPAVLSRLQARSNLRILEFPGADHSLEVEGDAIRSVENIRDLLGGIESLIPG